MQQFINGIQKYKHRLATFALIFGFFVDVVTFRSIDLSWSQTILAFHVIVVAVSILILARPAGEPGSWFQRVRSWVPLAHQYSTGALLSAFLILYSASGSIRASWPFLLLVVIAAVGNEMLKLQKYRLPFQTSLFFLNLMLFSALSVPIALNSVGARTFLVSVIIAAIAFALFTRIGRLVSRHAFKANMFSIRLGWIAVLGLVLFLYFTNLIPPIPLSLKDTGVYHHVARTSGGYEVRVEPRTWAERFFDLDGTTVHIIPGESVYAFTAVFAPADLATNVVHTWEFFDSTRGIWETGNTVEFPIIGGRDGGYRGYSRTDNPAEGRWRVSVKTMRGQVIGRVYINVKRVGTPVETISTTL